MPKTIQLSVHNRNYDLLYFRIALAKTFKGNDYYSQGLRALGTSVRFEIPVTDDDQQIVFYRGYEKGLNVEKASPNQIIGFLRLDTKSFVWPTMLVNFDESLSDCLCERVDIPSFKTKAELNRVMSAIGPLGNYMNDGNPKTSKANKPG